jgi:hypothetical protein
VTGNLVGHILFQLHFLEVAIMNTMTKPNHEHIHLTDDEKFYVGMGAAAVVAVVVSALFA